MIAILLFVSLCAAGQPGRRLDKLGDNEMIPAGQAAFYGDFIQRLKKFKSGGYPQDIRIINIETNEVFIFRVKSTFKTSKENPFCYLIEPGTYAILNYWWTESKWYGGKSYMEPIYKGEDSILETARICSTSTIWNFRQTGLPWRQRLRRSRRTTSFRLPAR